METATPQITLLHRTSHTVRFKNTATLQAEIVFIATLHEKMPNTATPQILNVPLL